MATTINYARPSRHHPQHSSSDSFTSQPHSPSHMTTAVIPTHSMHFPSVEGPRNGAGYPRIETEQRASNFSRRTTRVSSPSPSAPLRQSSLRPGSPSSSARSSTAEDRSPVDSRQREELRPSVDRAPRPKRQSSAGPERPRMISQTSREPERNVPQTSSHNPYRNLEVASLSTPELHLASDPMIDTDEPILQRQRLESSVSQAGKASKRAGGHKAKGPSVDTHGVSYAGLMSISAVMSTVASGSRKVSENRKLPASSSSVVSEPAQSSHKPRDRKLSAALLGRGSSKKTVAVEVGSPSEVSSSGSQATLGGGTAGTGATSASQVSQERTSISNPTSWFKRQRRWSSHARGSQDDSTSTSSRRAPGEASEVSIATTRTGNTTVSAESTPAHPRTSFSHEAAPSSPPTTALEKLRSARAFMVEELGQLTVEEMGEDKTRIASLAWFEREREAEARGLNVDSSREIVEFWTSIADGVLLCLLANCLRPGSVDRIDRRDVEWVKADNISRFLRAARDHVGLRSKDLFQTLDLTDATTVGLDRVVHTLLAVQSHSQHDKRMSIPTRLHSSARRSSSTKSSSRTSPPATPPDDPRISCEVVSSDIPFPGGRASPRRSDSGPRPQQLTKLQHRQMAERALVANIVPAPLKVDASVRSRRRRSNDMAGGVPLPGSRVKNGSSITFADQAPHRNSPHNGSDEDLVARMPYRDRKLSESAVSLTGVAEEADEDLVPSRPSVRVRPPPSPRHRDSFQLSPEEEDYPASPVSSSHGHSAPHHSFYALGAAGASSGGLASPVPMSRNNSQRRISTELARLGASTPTTDAFDDYAYSPTSNSPVRPAGGAAAVRRHSLRTAHAPSSLNPSRDAVTPSEPTPSPGPPLARVPFPRSVSSNDSPSSKRIGRHLSLNAGIANSSWIAASEASSFVASPTSPKAVPSGRPAYRHMRYSSDLHLPTTQSAMREQREMENGAVSTLGNSEDRLLSHSFASASALSQSFGARPRYESELSSSFYANTPSSFTTTDEAGVSRLTRDPSLAPSSKHKLVVKEEGKPNVTYQVGNCIGRGQFGSVYRALNLNSGQMVAVKRIKFEGRSETEVTQLMHEVDLLKSLTHPSVVKYEGLVRGPDVVSIILEYVENGSLLHTLKAFGHFPEKLVASYVVKILEGLNYLHDMKVVHCDLKAANILTTKNGNVKLSDFGVSLNLKAAEKIKTEKADAIGTPNWMAPEVIELKGASTAADIWSLACTIIELLTGKPPYGDMLAMSAMFRIVEDECPPIPEKVSEPLREFLISCFNKEPTLRPTAEELCDHVWLKTTWTGHKQLRTQDSVPFLRRISADFRKLDSSTLADLASLPSTMERSTSSPPPLSMSPMSLERPQLNEMRALSTPNWGASSGPDGLGGLRSLSPTSPSVLAILDRAARRGSDTSSVEMLRSPLSAEGDPTSPAPVLVNDAVNLPPNPSMLDLDQLGLDDEGKPHAFVKSTFSKAVQCKVCREPVKKHAVLCEECGLVCHARCTSSAPSPCNLRAQLILFANGRTSGEASRINSPSPSSFSVSSNHPPTSPLLSPIGFKFPFTKNKRNSRGYEPPTSPPPAAQVVPSPSPSPAPSHVSNNKVKDESTSRRRRLSLRPLARQRSPSPSGEPPSSATIIMREPPTPTGPIMVRGDSVGSSTKRREARRHSTLSYGSMSGSSSVSSASVNGGGGIVMVKTTSGGSINEQDIRLNQALKEAQARRSGDVFRANASMMASMPVLGSHAHDAESDVEAPGRKEPTNTNNRPGRFRRRLSSNAFPFGQSASSLVRGSANQPPAHRVGHTARAVSMGQQDAFRLLDNNGGVTPTPEMIAERKKRNTKSDCIIS